MPVIVLVPAAGLGRRMGGPIGKQYLDLAGRPILAHTLDLFERHPLISRIYVIAPPDEQDFCRTQIVEKYDFSRVEAVVAGGGERQESVRNGLRACRAEDDDIIVIHDGVRPFFPNEMLPQIVQSAADIGGCVVGVPVKDTIKEVERGTVTGTPDRRRLWQAQTPQAFPFVVIQRAHETAWRDGFQGTDDASLVERLGLPVAIVEGSYRNIKITTPDDMVLARAFFQE